MTRIFKLSLLLLILSSSTLYSCKSNASNQNETSDKEDHDTIPVNEDLSAKLHLKEFTDRPIWEQIYTNTPLDYANNEFANGTSIHFEGDYFVINNQQFNVRAIATTLDKITDITNDDRKPLIDLYVEEKDSILYFEFQNADTNWTSSIHPSGFPQIKKVISDRKNIFLICTDTISVHYNTASYIGDTYPLPLKWGNRYKENKEYSVSDYPPLDRLLNELDKSQDYYAYQILYKSELLNFYLLKSTVEGSEFDQPCYHLASLTQSGGYHKIAIPTERVNLFVDKHLDITLTYDPMDSKSFESYAKSADASSVFVEKYKVDLATGELKLESKQRNVLNENDISPYEFDQRLMNNLNDRIPGMQEAIFATDTSTVTIQCNQELTGLNKALTLWTEKRLNNFPYTLTFSQIKTDIPNLRLILVNPYQGGDNDNDFGIIVSKNNITLSYLDLSFGGYHTANYMYKIHPNGLIETGTGVVNLKSDDYNQVFRVRDRWQIQEDGTIKKVPK